VSLVRVRMWGKLALGEKESECGEEGREWVGESGEEMGNGNSIQGEEIGIYKARGG